MKHILKSALILLIFTITHFAQSTDSIKIIKLRDMGLYTFPSSDEIKNIPFDDSLIQAIPLSELDINDEFNNIEDLDWLKEIAKNNKVILLGEEHYHKYIANIRNRILFYLNTIDHFPLLVLENQYSLTGYLQYYLNIADDKKANDFYDEVISGMIGSVHDGILLRNIRRWNTIHPSKQITIGCSDIEHNYRLTISRTLLPYFRKIDPDIKVDPGDIDLEECITIFNGLLRKAEEDNITGDYSFLTPRYIRNVLTNLQSTFYSNQYDLNYYRQKSIVRNLTGNDFFGKYFETGKVLIHGGSDHTTTHFSHPDNGNFFREGSYLSEDYEPTKGKVYSISFHSFFRSLGNSCDTNVDSSQYRNTAYDGLLSWWQKAYKQNLITPEDYLIDFEISDFHKLFLKTASYYNNKPLLINQLNWDAALVIAKQNDKNNLYNTIKYWKPDHYRYDKHIFIPGSPFMEVLKLNP